MIATIQINDKKYNYHIWNENNEKNVFLVHGLGDDIQSFSKTIEFLLSKNVKIIGLNLIGCGVNSEVNGCFEDNLNMFFYVYEKEKSSKTNTIVGHSMGGLIVLLSAIRFSIVPDNLITIEPSITDADYNFFRYIQEKPIGLGFNNFLQQIIPSGYLATYKKNIEKSNTVIIKKHIKYIYDNFKKYQQYIIKSNICFYYIYGGFSSGIEIRRKMNRQKNVNVLVFEKSEHWVHYDEAINFNNFLSTKI